MCEKIACHQIAIWGLRSAQIKRLKKTDTHFFKRWGSVLFNFFIWVLPRPQIAIQCCANISCANFSRFGALQIKISVSKNFRKISHPKIEVSPFLSDFSKEVTNNRLTDIQEIQYYFQLVCKHPRSVSKNFKNISHLEVEITTSLSHFSKEVAN